MLKHRQHPTARFSTCALRVSDDTPREHDLDWLVASGKTIHDLLFGAQLRDSTGSLPTSTDTKGHLFGSTLVQTLASQGGTLSQEYS